MDKIQALQEYKEALSVALQKRWQYAFLLAKESAYEFLGMTEDTISCAADDFTAAFFSRLQGGNIEDRFNYEELMGYDKELFENKVFQALPDDTTNN